MLLKTWLHWIPVPLIAFLIYYLYFSHDRCESKCSFWNINYMLYFLSTHQLPKTKSNFLFSFQLFLPSSSSNLCLLSLKRCRSELHGCKLFMKWLLQLFFFLFFIYFFLLSNYYSIIYSLVNVNFYVQGQPPFYGFPFHSHV